MKITHWLDYQEEIEIDISHEDISILWREAYSEAPKDVEGAILSNLNSIAGFLKSIPDKVIDGFPDSTRKIVATFLKEQGQRIERLGKP